MSAPTDTKFKPQDRVLITSIDMYGFTGRELHPDTRHNGKWATVVGWCWRLGLTNPEDFIGEPIDFYVVMLDGGREFLQLMDDEMELTTHTSESKAATIAVSTHPKGGPNPEMDTQLETVRNLMECGYVVSHIHSDCTIDLTKRDVTDREVVTVSVTADGSVGRPRTASTMRHLNYLRENNFNVGEVSTRYYADMHGDPECGERVETFVFDTEDDHQVCCGPFEGLSAACGAAEMLNDASGDPNGIRPHQVQHNLDRQKALSGTTTQS